MLHTSIKPEASSNQKRKMREIIILNPKLHFLIKLIQSRKTQYTIDQIRTTHKDEEGHFFIYCCHSILAAANQTLGRIKEKMIESDNTEDIYQPNETPKDILMFSSEQGKCGTIEKVQSKLIETDPTKFMGMCMLLHPSRFKKRGEEDPDIIKILKFLQSNRMPEIKKITLYCDEFDKYDFLVDKLEDICSFSKVIRLQLISATFKDSKLLKVYGDIPDYMIEKAEAYDRKNYVTYEEQQKAGQISIHDFPDTSVVDYIVKNIKLILKLKEYKKDNDDLYICAPCPVKRTYHTDLAEILGRIGITTVLYNSDFKGAILPCGFKIKFEKISNEPAEVIKYYKSKYNLKNIVVSGNLCINRAVTLQTFGLVFDYCILHHGIASTGDSLYQADRSRGNTKLYRPDRLCGLICTSKCLDIIKRAEQYALIGETGRSVREHIKMVDVGLKTYDPSMTVPRIFTVTDEDMAIILPRKGPNRHMAILGLLARLDTEFAQKIWYYKCIQASESKSDSSYKKHITDVVSAAKHRQPYAVDIKPEHKSENIWECFIDSKENRLCFIVWEGAR
jgi:hypothetical protein